MRVRQLIPFVFFISISCMPRGSAAGLDSAIDVGDVGVGATGNTANAADTNACTEESTDVDNGSNLQSPYKYVGNHYSHKFHLPDCPFAQAMSKWNAEYFRTRKEAEEHGEKPCHWCLPTWWKSVSAIIVGSSNNSSNRSNNSNVSNTSSPNNDSDVGNTSNNRDSN